MNDEKLVTSSDVAGHFGVSVETVNDWVRRRRIPFLRLSRKTVRFRLSDVIRAASQFVTTKGKTSA